jgi:CheY-like chemotaxis protein
VVDDDDTIRRLVRIILEADGWQVLEAANGEEALERISAHAPPFVVLDVMMPGVDGLEVCRRVDHDAMKVVVLTARPDRDTEERCREAGADAFLAKPFSSIRLLDVLDELAA